MAKEEENKFNVEDVINRIGAILEQHQNTMDTQAAMIDDLNKKIDGLNTKEKEAALQMRLDNIELNSQKQIAESKLTIEALDRKIRLFYIIFITCMVITIIMSIAGLVF